MSQVENQSRKATLNKPGTNKAVLSRHDDFVHSLNVCSGDKKAQTGTVTGRAMDWFIVALCSYEKEQNVTVMESIAVFTLQKTKAAAPLGEFFSVQFSSVC